jgi:hypothetical protein
MKGTIFLSLFIFIDMDFQELIDDLHDGGDLAKSFFGDFQTFFAVLDKRGYLDQIDIEDSEIQNELLLFLKKSYPQQFNQFIMDKLTDLEIDEDGRVFLDLSDLSDLSELFCDRSSRDGLSRAMVEEILNGEFDNWFEYTTDSVYDDVISELNPKNHKILADYIVNSLQNTRISPETEVLSEIANEQGHPDYVTVDSSVVETILDDKETMTHLLSEELQDLDNSLYSIHINAYSSAYESAVINSIWSELQEYVEGKGQFYSIPHKFKKDTVIQRFTIPVASNFHGIIEDYLRDKANRGNRGLLEYYGSYISLIADNFDCLTVYGPDYPDYSEIKNNINEIFVDYL